MMIDNPATTYIVSVFEKPHLAHRPDHRGDKAEADTLEGDGAKTE
jgi:hypothetical protein